jgi:cellulose synthase/poly-beta-1,6-N-acetylglucosamine synthase-like glycosyltransferase
MVSYSLFILAGIALLAATHPFITYPISLRLLLRWHRPPIRLYPPESLADTTVALCLCAYNEEGVIRTKVENMLAMRRNLPRLEVLVYVDAASDHTAEILAEFGDSVRVVLSPERLGKTHGMNVLVQLTSADIIVFTDANVIFADDALLNLLRPFGDPSIGCALGHLRYISSADNATSATGSLYWNMEERLKELESRTGSAITSDGAIFAIRRALHAPPPPEVSDDIFVSLSILCARYRVVRVGTAIAYEEAVASAAEEYNRKIRIACLAFTVHRMLWPRLRRLPPLDLYKYVSHKLLRWLTIYLLAAGSVCFIGGFALSLGWLTATALAVIEVVALTAIWFSKTGPLGKLSSVLQAFVSTGIGVWKSMAGIRFQTWTPPASTRGQIVGATHTAVAGRVTASRRIATATPRPSKIDA